MGEYSFLTKVKLLIYDCDGVLTDNKVTVDQSGNEYATFHRGDGWAITHIPLLGIKQAVVSTEKNPIVLHRCRKLNLEVHYGVDNKLEAVRRYCADSNIPMESVMYIGNDLNDYDCMKAIGIRGCPSDAEPEIKEICEWVSSKTGGSGVIRELYRMLSEEIGNGTD